jgi:hypothetical protein
MEKMISNYVSNIDIIEEKGIKNTSLYIGNIKCNLESYEYKILSEENIDNILKFQLTYDGENRVLKYDVSNTLSLEEYVKTNKLSKKDICNILTSIDEILLSIENYLLSENSLFLDLKAIRLMRYRNNMIKYKFVAMPNANLDFSYELSKFLIRILKYVDVEDRDALSLAYGLFVRSSKDNYTMNDLMELIDKARDNEDIESYDVSVDDLMNYDEEIAKEISEEIMEENKFDMSNIDEDEYEKVVETGYNKRVDEEDISMDDETKDMLKESLFNDFNKEDKKILKFQKKAFGLKKKKALKGHINVGIIGLSLAPILLILLPTLYFILYV